MSRSEISLPLPLFLSVLSFLTFYPTTFRSVSILWSQPITSLEVLMPDNQWRLVKHRPNALVLNAGDALHFLSGSFIKPTIHRVVAPPADQAHYTRLGIFYFARELLLRLDLKNRLENRLYLPLITFPVFNDDVPLQPLLESPVVREAYKGKNFWKWQEETGEKVPTAGEWERLRVRAYGQGGTKKRDDGHEEETIAGMKITQYNSIEKKKADNAAKAVEAANAAVQQANTN